MSRPKPHDHCPHVSGMPFGFQQANGVRVVGIPHICCWCGPTFVVYQGIVETGHGPHLIYVPARRMAPAGLVLPNGLDPMKVRQ